MLHIFLTHHVTNSTYILNIVMLDTMDNLWYSVNRIELTSLVAHWKPATTLSLISFRYCKEQLRLRPGFSRNKNDNSNPPELPLSSQSLGWVRWCQVRSTRSSCDCPFVINYFLFWLLQRRVYFAVGGCDMPKPTKKQQVKAILGDGISFLYHGCNATETRSFCRWLSMNIVQNQKSITYLASVTS